MLANTVLCPQCQTPLRSAAPIPAGARVKCPKCATSFTVPAAAVAATAVTAQPAGNGVAVPAAAVAAGAPPVVRPLSSPNVPTAAPDVARPKRGVLMPVMLGVGGLLVVGLVAVWLLSRRAQDNPAAAAETDKNETKKEDAKPPRPKQRPLIVLNAADERKVKAMTSKGVEFLKKEQDKSGNGSWNGGSGWPAGETAMAGLTLLECGVPATDPAIRNATYYLRDASPNLNRTYELALAILFLNRLGDPQDKGLIQKLAVRLAAGQYANGGWGYTCPILIAEDHYKFLHILQDLQNTSPAKFKAQQKKSMAQLPADLKDWNKPGPPGVLHDTGKEKREFFRGISGKDDNSNTQFALLALWTAKRHDLPLKAPLTLVARRFALSQEDEGSWLYHRGGIASPTFAPTMTCAGLLGMAVHYGLKESGGKQGPARDPAIQKGLTVLAAHIGKMHKDGEPPLEMYYLWSVERVAVLFRLKKIGEEDWYHWGMKRLSASQDAGDGSWKAPAGHGSNKVTDTCFALLFLQRVNLAEDLTDKLRELEALMGRSEEASRD
jgi:hypothetical protein